MMSEAGIVGENGKPKFSYHGLRHWFGAFWTKHTDVHEAKTWLGHKHASTTLDVYGFHIDDAEGRAKFEATPDWLSPPIETGAIAAPTRPALLPAQPAHASPVVIESEWIEVPSYAERWVLPFISEVRRVGDVDRALTIVGKGRKEARYELQRCGMPALDELEAMAVAVMDGPAATEEIAPPTPIASLEEPCPIDVPDIAAGWVKPYIRARAQGMTHEAASRTIRKHHMDVTAELKRVKLPAPAEIARRLRKSRIAKLLRQGYQDRDVAPMVGLKDRGMVTRVRNELLLRNDSTAKPLKVKDKSPPAPKADTRPEHKKQLKLL
jgi:hypothetical protein